MAKFLENELFYDNGTLKLAGIAMLPKEGLHPGAVFVHGSGYSDRRNPWYKKVADYLARHGVAVLLPDKRGCYKSEGDWRVADFHDLAMDAIAGVNILRNQNGVDSTKVGLIGISQGGWIVPIAAHECNNIAFVISVSGAATTPIEQLRHQVTQDIKQKGLPAALSHFVFPFSNYFLQRRWPSWHNVQCFDPMPLWETLPVPGLLVFGQEDEWDNVPVSESVRQLEIAKQHTKCAKLSVKVFERSGHGLLEPESGNIRPDFLQLLVEWITSIH